jgi:hypothetical protein
MRNIIFESPRRRKGKKLSPLDNILLHPEQDKKKTIRRKLSFPGVVDGIMSLLLPGDLENNLFSFHCQENYL